MLPRSNNSQFSFSKIQIHLQPNPEVFQSDKSKHLISCAFFKVNVLKQFAEMQLRLHVWHPQAVGEFSVGFAGGGESAARE